MNFRISGGLKEHGVVVGNAYDKYGSKNLIIKLIMKRFSRALCALVDAVAPQSIHEIGCGEGFWVLEWNKAGLKARGCDFSDKVIRLARDNASKVGLPSSLFNVRSIYQLSPIEDLADLIICCEVLEHLEDVELVLENLSNITENYLIISVPREPIWRLLNFIRGRYLNSYGNTPGHIQHWSKKEFIKLVSQYFEIVSVSNPLPWTMLLCRPHRR